MTTPSLLTGATVVTPEAALPEGVVVVDEGHIVAVLDCPADAVQLGPIARGVYDAAERIDLGGGYLTPGLIDIHVHGGAAAAFDNGAEAIAAGVAAHRRCGTTSTFVSLITAAEDDMVDAIRGAVDAAAADPRIRGVHLEGPFLAETKRGAHDPSKLRDPDRAAFDRFLAAGDGLVRMITLAPELPGGMDLVRAAVAADVHAAVGHCEADYAQAAAAFEAGADVVTHAFNAMRPLHHRDPGVIAAGRDAGAVLEAINDGVHLHDGTVRLLNALAAGTLAFITDAMAAACADDGHYRLGSLDVEVVAGEARLAGGGSIAGSTLTMDRAVRRAVTVLGMDMVDAVNAATRVPARVAGVADELGAIAPAMTADLVLFDDDWHVKALMLDGEWGDERRP